MICKGEASSIWTTILVILRDRIDLPKYCHRKKVRLIELGVGKKIDGPVSPPEI